MCACSETLIINDKLIFILSLTHTNAHTYIWIHKYIVYTHTQLLATLIIKKTIFVPETTATVSYDPTETIATQRPRSLTQANKTNIQIHGPSRLPTSLDVIEFSFHVNTAQPET